MPETCLKNDICTQGCQTKNCKETMESGLENARITVKSDVSELENARIIAEQYTSHSKQKTWFIAKQYTSHNKNNGICTQ